MRHLPLPFLAAIIAGICLAQLVRAFYTGADSIVVIALIGLLYFEREDALDKLVGAQGFEFHIVAGDFTEAALENGDDLYWQEMRAWNPEAPVGEWRLAWKGDTEDGPYTLFVRPMALSPKLEATQHAPVVDLGQFRQVVSQAIGDTGRTETEHKLGELLALIDSQRVAAPEWEMPDLAAVIEAFLKCSETTAKRRVQSTPSIARASGVATQLALRDPCRPRGSGGHALEAKPWQEALSRLAGIGDYLGVRRLASHFGQRARRHPVQRPAPTQPAHPHSPREPVMRDRPILFNGAMEPAIQRWC